MILGPLNLLNGWDNVPKPLQKGYGTCMSGCMSGIRLSISLKHHLKFFETPLNLARLIRILYGLKKNPLLWANRRTDEPYENITFLETQIKICMQNINIIFGFCALRMFQEEIVELAGFSNNSPYLVGWVIRFHVPTFFHQFVQYMYLFSCLYI